MEGNDESWYSKIYTLDANNKRYYFGIGHQKIGTLKENESIQAFTIEKGNLNDTLHIIKTQSGLTGSLGFEYGLYNDVPDGNLIRYDDSTKTIRFPVVMGNGMITKRKIIYKFTGVYFEKIK